MPVCGSRVVQDRRKMGGKRGGRQFNGKKEIACGRREGITNRTTQVW